MKNHWVHLGLNNCFSTCRTIKGWESHILRICRISWIWFNLLLPAPLSSPPLPFSADHADCHLDECHRYQWSGARWVSRRRRHTVVAVWVRPRRKILFFADCFWRRLARRSLTSRETLKALVWGRVHFRVSPHNATQHKIKRRPSARNIKPKGYVFVSACRHIMQ